MIDKDIANHIVSLSTTAQDRVFTGNAEQGTKYPAVVVRRVAGETPRTLDGAALLSRSTFTIDVYGTSYTTVFDTALAIRTSLDGYYGTMGTTQVLNSQYSNIADYSEVDGDQVIRHISQDFNLLHR